MLKSLLLASLGLIIVTIALVTLALIVLTIVSVFIILALISVLIIITIIVLTLVFILILILIPIRITLAFIIHRVWGIFSGVQLLFLTIHSLDFDTKRSHLPGPFRADMCHSAPEPFLAFIL